MATRTRRTDLFRAITLSLAAFSTETSPAQTIELSALGNRGFEIKGGSSGDHSGRVISSAGDFNGDGLEDIIIGAPLAAPDSQSNAGNAYVAFGKTDTTDVDLDNLGSSGVTIFGFASEDRVGTSVSGGGDINGDGLSDVAVGARYGDPRGEVNPGETFVVFGKTDTAFVATGAALGSEGFRINGAARQDHSGRSVSIKGDINGDGLSDIIRFEN